MLTLKYFLNMSLGPDAYLGTYINGLDQLWRLWQLRSFWPYGQFFPKKHIKGVKGENTCGNIFPYEFWKSLYILAHKTPLGPHCGPD